MDRWRPIAGATVARFAPLRRVPGLLWRMPAQAKAGVAAMIVVLLVIGSVLFVRNPAGPFGKIEPLPASTGTLTRIPVLGPGHRWPYAVLPLYWLWMLSPKSRDTARRLYPVKLRNVVRAIGDAVDTPPNGVRIIEAPEMRRA